jgi:hypothetical protein
MFILTMGFCSNALGQPGLAVEVSGGIGLPGWTDWASYFNIGPAASIGLSGEFGQKWGWVVGASYNSFAYKKELGETINQYESEPPGEVIVVETRDVDGGAFSTFLGLLGVRAELSESRISRSYILMGLLLGRSEQASATVDRTVTENGETTGPERVTWIGENSDLAIGLTARLGVSRRFNEQMGWFAEAGYQFVLTPDDSVPDNPDFLVAQIGIRLGL